MIQFHNHHVLFFQNLNERKDSEFNLSIKTNPGFVGQIGYANEAQNLGWKTPEDSLVTQKLLQLTSYDEASKLDSFSDASWTNSTQERDRELHSTVLNDPKRENRMSFDELGKVYTSISRRDILSKVKVGFFRRFFLEILFF